MTDAEVEAKFRSLAKDLLSPTPDGPAAGQALAPGRGGGYPGSSAADPDLGESYGSPGLLPKGLQQVIKLAVHSQGNPSSH